jgi:predicted dehydrogenase
MAAAKKHNVVITEAFMYKHHPQTLKVLELVEQETIGELLLIKGAFTFNLDRPDDVRWVPEWGGGSIWDVGCYPISFSRLVAHAEPLEVFGWQATGSTGIDIVFSGQMRFASGLLAQFDCGFRTPYRTAMEIVGTKGSIELHSPFKPAGGEWIKIKRGDSVERFDRRNTNCIAADRGPGTAVLDGRPPRRWRTAAPTWRRFWRCWNQPHRTSGAVMTFTMKARVPVLLNRDSLYYTFSMGLDVGVDVRETFPIAGPSNAKITITTSHKTRINAYSTRP